MKRAALTAAVLVAAVACSNPYYFWLKPGSTSTHLVFEHGSKPHGGRPGPIDYVLVSSCGGGGLGRPARGETPQWRVGYDHVDTIADRRGPIEYGVTPPGLVEQTAPTLLGPGCYRLDGSTPGATGFLLFWIRNDGTAVELTKAERDSMTVMDNAHTIRPVDVTRTIEPIGSAINAPVDLGVGLAHLAPLGDFIDDYGEEYKITPREWLQRPHGRLLVARWEVGGSHLIALNDSSNQYDPGKWSRIDWIKLDGMAPWEWAYCLSAYNAPTPDSAEATHLARPDTPRTGCNGHPYTRLKRQPEPSGSIIERCHQAYLTAGSDGPKLLAVDAMIVDSTTSPPTRCGQLRSAHPAIKSSE